MPRIVRPRRGIALVISLLAIVVIGALIVSAFFASTQEYRVGRNTLVVQRAFSVAEYGLNSEIASWDKGRYLPGSSSYMPPGAVDNTPVYVADGDTARVKVSRLNTNTFWVVSEGSAGMGVAQVKSVQRTNALVRIAYPSVNVRGALTSAEDIRINGAGEVWGSPQAGAPAWKHLDNWAQCGAIPNSNESKYGISVPPGTTVGPKLSSVQGVPASIEYNPAAGDDATYIQYGDETYQSLAAQATWTIPAGAAPIPLPTIDATTTKCDIKSKSNWGEPFRGATSIPACQNHFPIIHLTGLGEKFNAQGRGQGILLIDGDLEFAGTFDWYGLIVVNGRLKGNGTANIYGAVMARGGDIGNEGSSLIGDQNIYFSRCALDAALSGSAPLIYVKERSWSQLF